MSRGGSGKMCIYITTQSEFYAQVTQKFYPTAPGPSADFKSDLSLTPVFLQLQIPERRERDKRERDAQPHTDVCADTPDQLRHGPDIPDLIHADDRTRPADEESDQSGRSDREPRLVLPRRPVEADAPAENEVLLQNDGHENHDPVAHEREEVFENRKQVVAPRDRADEVDNRNDADPEVAGQGFAVATQHLAAQRGGVRAGDVVRDDAQRNDHTAEFFEAAQVAVAREDERAGGRGERGRPFRGAGDPGGETDPDEVDEAEREGESGECHEEDLPFGGGFRVVDVKVGGGGGPGDGDGEDEGEEGEAAGCYSAGVATGLRGGVEVRVGYADEDEEDD